MTDRQGHVVVEGHGEQGAVPNLLHRLATDLQLRPVHWAAPIRLKGLDTPSGMERACELVRSKNRVQCMLVLRDDDDGCPKEDGPRAAELIRRQELPFPAACVLCFREFESLFAASLGSISGHPLRGVGGNLRPGLRADASWTGDLEAKRDVKGWLSSQMPPGRVYKPRVDQLAMTRLVDFGLVRESGLSWFGTLERALKFLLGDSGPGAAYP